MVAGGSSAYGDSGRPRKIYKLPTGIKLNFENDMTTAGDRTGNIMCVWKDFILITLHVGIKQFDKMERIVAIGNSTLFYFQLFKDHLFIES